MLLVVTSATTIALCPTTICLDWRSRSSHSLRNPLSTLDARLEDDLPPMLTSELENMFFVRERELGPIYRSAWVGTTIYADVDSLDFWEMLLDS